MRVLKESEKLAVFSFGEFQYTMYLHHPNSKGWILTTEYRCTGTITMLWSGVWSGAVTALPERSTWSIDLVVAGKARRYGMGIMILPHGPVMTGGEFLRYALDLDRRYMRDYDAVSPSTRLSPCRGYTWRMQAYAHVSPFLTDLNSQLQPVTDRLKREWTSEEANMT